jgi:hypothetical protein
MGISMKLILLTFLMSRLAVGQFAQDTVKMSVNKLITPFGNNGRIGDVYNDFVSYEGHKILWAGGFFLAGMNKDGLWANGEYHIYDYLPGPINSDPGDAENKIYVVKSGDSDFGRSWQDWRTAVNLGAKYYDGDSDGNYNPEDLNGNGVWDLNEDRPDLLGDYTAWCIINDGVPSSERYWGFEEVEPQGIEIKITVFASGPPEQEYLSNVIFVRYIIENTGISFEKLDSVYFGIVADADIGYSNDDMIGYDTARNSAFIYNNGTDDEYGETPPALLTDILMGPHVYIPGATFTDNNLNGFFELEIDTPLDTAYVYEGPYLGIRKFPGAKNLNPLAHTGLIKSTWDYRDPDFKEQMLSYLKGGRNIAGADINVCELQYGNGSELANCSEINNRFMYSGDPVNKLGWLYMYPFDVRNLISMGPFDLPKGEEAEIMIAYIAGRGNDAINSIMVAKNIDDQVQRIYDNNFADLPVDVDNGQINLKTSYLLYQNYPNPFNPSTVISFELAEDSHVTINIYDMLGQLVTKLSDGIFSAGQHDKTWIAVELSAGVYLYEIRAESLISSRKYSAVRKMLLVK